MKLIIAGSRKCGMIANKTWDYDFLINQIDEIIKRNRIIATNVISGNANGPDKAGEMWAKKNDIPITIMKPDWKNNRKSAGFNNNSAMAEIADALLVIYDGQSSGTKHMMNLMSDKGKSIFQ